MIPTEFCSEFSLPNAAAPTELTSDLVSNCGPYGVKQETLKTTTFGINR